MKFINLGEIASFINGDRGKNYPSQKDFQDSGIAFINAGHLSLDGHVDFNSMNYISIDKYAQLGSGKVERGDLLYCLRGSLGKTAIIDFDEPAAIASSLVILRPKQSLDRKYLYYFLTSPFGYKEIKKNDNGSSQPNLSAKSVKNYKIPLPPIAEQKRIAAILDKADAVRRKRREAIRLTEELLRSVFLDMFGDPVTNPKGWDTVKLEGLAEIQSGIAKGKKVNPESYISLPYMRVANIQDGYVDLSEIKEISINKKDIQRYSLKAGDILLTEGGDPDKLGRGAVWSGEIEPCIHQNHIFCVRPDSKIALPAFLSALIGSERGKRYFLRAAKQTTGIATINKTQLKSFPTLVPPLNLQKKYSEFVEQLEKNKALQALRAANIENLFNSLLQRAFTGEL